MAKGTLLKAFVKYTGQNKIIPGSLVVQHHKPKSGLWKEVPYDVCCGGGACNNCTPGTITLSQTFTKPPQFPSIGITMNFEINAVGCPDLNSNSGSLSFYLVILGQTFNFQDIVNLLNTSEIAKRNGIGNATLTVGPEGETIQITVDKCSCLGIYLSGNVSSFSIDINIPA